jgi:endoglucanase
MPVCCLASPTPVLILMPDGRRVPALTSPFDAQPPPGERYVLLNLPIQTPLSPSLPVVFDLPDFAVNGDSVRMRALDDLAGCAAVLSVLVRLAAQDAEADVYGVFTRAEETGLFGARLMAEAKTLPRRTLVVSVESSAVISGVAQGEGPVIRVGDAAWTFDADAEQALLAARDAVRKRRPDFKVQRALMSGGTCEATAFALTGYRTTGVAFPLGNYHNATTRIADPNGGVDAEFIRISDFLDGVELLTETALAVARGDESPIRRRLGPVPDEVRQRLGAR